MVRTIAKCAAALCVFAATSTSLQADTTSVTAKVTRTLAVADDRWGGCAAQLDVSLVDEGLANCNDKWVTFSCSGDHASSKSSAMRMFDQAQMAFALGRQVRVYVDDTKTHNGFCFVDRIDVLAS
ncbi:MAG: hypothetical protein OXQ90_10245 [Gammaproteobacteria bacterium]|nr:hypothetical protein [Gammaproteobacteria bacterium]